MYEFGKPVGIMGFLSPLYYLGKSTAETTPPAFVNQTYKETEKGQGEILAVVNKKLKKIQI